MHSVEGRPDASLGNGVQTPIRLRCPYDHVGGSDAEESHASSPVASVGSTTAVERNGEVAARERVISSRHVLGGILWGGHLQGKGNNGHVSGERQDLNGHRPALGLVGGREWLEEPQREMGLQGSSTEGFEEQGSIAENVTGG